MSRTVKYYWRDSILPMHLLDHMKKTLLLVSLLSLLGGTQAFARVQETRIHFTDGGAAANTSTVAAVVTMDWWNKAAITTGAPAVRPNNTTIQGLSLKDTQGVTSRYTFGYTKTGSAGIWSYNSQTVPVNPHYNVPDAYRTGGGVGGNNGTISSYSISGLTVGDTLDLAFGGLVNVGATYKNRYVVTISGATIANVNADTEIYFSNNTASSWSKTANSVTLTIGDGNTSAQSGFAAMLSGLTMTSNTLAIQIDTRTGTGGAAASGSGSSYGLSYMSIIPEPATASLSLLGLAVLTLRRRRK